jgi:transcriptional regulator with XRE-family HTH domain
MDINKTFGIVLKKNMLNKKFSQEKLALASNLDRTYTSLLERGLRSISLKTLFAITSVLEIKVSNLISEFELELKKKEDI